MSESASPSDHVLPAIAEDLFCQNCGYNLRGLTGEVCPECGASLAGVRSKVSQIPWVQRKELGWWRAYWKTVFFVMFRQRLFAEEMARPVSYWDSQWFRWLTVAITCVPVLVAGLGFWIVHAQTPTDNPLFNIFWVEGLGGVWHACFVLFVAAATGLPSYFFHPRNVPTVQQNRAIALSYYACGPLALFPFPVVCAFGAIVLASTATVDMISQALRFDVQLLCWLLAALVPTGQVAAWWLDLVHLSRRLVPQNPRRAVWLAVGVPSLWLVAGFLLLVALPCVVLFPVLIFRSFRG